MGRNYETSTAWWIEKEDIKLENRLNLMSKLSVLDYMDKTEIPTAYFEMDGYITIPKIKKELVEAILKTKLPTEKIVPQTEVNAIYNKLTFDPLPHQVGILRDSVSHLKTSQDKRLCLCARPGFGKTYMAAYIIKELECKFMFVVYSGKLVDQTYEAFSKYFGARGLLMLKSSSMFREIKWKNVSGVFLTHTMLQVLIKSYGVNEVIDTFQNKMGVSLKIVDEYDRNVKNLYFMECWSNFKYNLYLTGTKFLNLRPNDRIFQMIYRSVKTVGHDVRLPSIRHSIVVKYNFSPTRKEYMQATVSDGKFFKLMYNECLARKDVLLDFIMKTFYKPDNSIMKSVLKEGDSIVIYCGRIENCNIVKEKLIENFGIAEKDIGIYNSGVKKATKVEAEDKPFIITTTDSMGRGYDNPKLRVLIFLEFNFGISSFTQNVSRVGRVGGKEGWVIEGLDQSFAKVVMHHKKKVADDIYKDLFKDMVYFEVPQVAYKYYYFGYRPNSKIAKELRNKRR